MMHESSSCPIQSVENEIVTAILMIFSDLFRNIDFSFFDSRLYGKRRVLMELRFSVDVHYFESKKRHFRSS